MTSMYEFNEIKKCILNVHACITDMAYISVCIGYVFYKSAILYYQLHYVIEVY